MLGFVVEPKGHTYVGIDVNPDMVKSARRRARAIGSKNLFILGDARSRRLDGKFDTVSLLGNALIHFDATDFSRILRNIDKNCRRRSYFLAEYRDVVEMLFDGRWGERYEEVRSGKKIVSLRRGSTPNGARS